MGTVNLLEAVRAVRRRSRRSVVVTSDKCYREPRRRAAPSARTTPLGGRDPYSASKGCAELVTAAYAASFFADGAAAVATARAGNVIGGGDWAADRIVPDCVRALDGGPARRGAQSRTPCARGSTCSSRSPATCCSASALLRDGHAAAGAWNFGPAPDDGALTVRWVVERFIEEWGAGSWVTPDGGEASRTKRDCLSLDSAKARARLGWAPVWDSAEAVRRTAAWYRGYHGDPRQSRRAPRRGSERVRRRERGRRCGCRLQKGRRS